MIGEAVTFLARFGPPQSELDDAALAAATDLLTRATAAVVEHCGRPFVVVPTAADAIITRTLPLPASATLLLTGENDLLPTPTPVLTLNSVAVAPTTYVLLRDGGRATGPVTAIQAVGTDGDPVLWDAATRTAARNVRTDFTITGRWGYADLLPAGFIELVYRWAAHLNSQQTGLYANAAGGNDLTGPTPVPRLVDADLAREAQAYRHPRAPREEIGRTA